MGLKDRILNSSKVQNALDEGWRIHSRMFREIMEPAFVGDDAARLELVAALNLITRNEFVKAVKKLDNMGKYCKCDADYTALLFFLGLACERGGDTKNGLRFMSEAAEYEPDFYLLYTMLAKMLYDIKDFSACEANYSMALRCIENKQSIDEVPAVNENTLLSTIYGNLAGCLLKMGRYDDAEWALYESEKYRDGRTELLITWAMLYAATDRVSLAREKAAELAEKAPELYASCKLMFEELIQHKNPRFHVQTKLVEKAHYDEFWEWFEDNAEDMAEAFENNESDAETQEIYEKLDEVFEFKREPVEFCVYRDDAGKIHIDFCDNYNATLSVGLDKLVEKAPSALSDRWVFGVLNR